MSVPERISRRVQALLEMSRRGTPHEKEIAVQKLTDLLDRHRLTATDIDPENVSPVYFPYRTKYEKLLILQIYYLVTGDGRRN